MEQRVSLTTLAVEDPSSTVTFHERPGWRVAGRTDDMVVPSVLDAGGRSRWSVAP